MRSSERPPRNSRAFYFTDMIKELKTDFIGTGQVRGFKFTQVKKTKNGYIYKLEHLGRVWYEVFERRVNVRYSVISYPRNKSFGKWAWTTSDFQRAKEILSEIELKAESNEG